MRKLKNYRTIEVLSPNGATASVPVKWLHRFESRYGYGSGGLLVDWFADPVKTPSEIAAHFHVKPGTAQSWLARYRAHNPAIPRRRNPNRRSSWMGADKNAWAKSFDARRGVGSYDNLIQMFEHNCLTLAEIGAAFGVTRERVRQWHERLVPFYPYWESTGAQRRKVCTLTKATMRPWPATLLPIVAALRERGLQPKIYLYRSNGSLKISASSFYLNGKLCIAHYAVAPSAPSSTRSGVKYWRFSCHRRPLGATMIFACGSPIREIYAIPPEVIARYRWTVYIPVSYDQFAAPNRRRVDWRPYEILLRRNRADLADAVLLQIQ